MMSNVGANAGRLTVVVLAAVLAAALAVALGVAVGGPVRPASAQTSSSLAITKAVYPSPQSAIPVGTRMDFLITEYNNSPYPYPRVVVRDALPAGVSFVSATPSQGSCNPMADEPTIYCELGSIPPGNAVHINIIVTATTPGAYTNTAYDMLGNQANAAYTIVPQGASVSAGGASVRTCPGGASINAGGASVTTGSGC